MKILYLQRHAKSSWGNASLTDRQRPLNLRGQRDAPRMGRRISKHEHPPNLIISSPALRALTTANIIASQLGINLDAVVTEDSIYGARLEALIQIIQDFPNEHESVMLTGHNPYLTYLANELSDSNIGNIPTCGLVVIRLDVTNWQEVENHGGKLLEFDYPKKFDAINLLGSKIDC